MLHFTAAEFVDRMARTRAEMAHRGLDALLLFAPESQYWLTGYDTFGFCFFQCLVVPAEADPVLLTRSADLRQAELTSTIRDIRVWRDAEGADPTADLAALLDDLGLAGRRIGWETRTQGLVHHHGARNVEAALAWIRHRHPHPRQVVVAGASAGAYGAVFHAPRIARLYPGADLIVVPDSGVPLLHDHETILAAWGIEAALGPAGGAGEARSWSLTTAYEKAVSAAGVRAMAVLTSDRDAVQGAFYLISGSPSWREETYALLDALERSHPSFHSFVVGGADHGLMRTDQFYDYRAGSVRLADWLGRLLAGEPVESVRCDGCRLP